MGVFLLVFDRNFFFWRISGHGPFLEILNVNYQIRWRPVREGTHTRKLRTTPSGKKSRNYFLFAPRREDGSFNRQNTNNVKTTERR